MPTKTQSRIVNQEFDLFSSDKMASAIHKIAEVAIPVPVDSVFSYLLPAELESKAKAGVRIRVPFKNRETVAYLVNVRERPVPEKLKSVIDILDEEPVLSLNMLELTRWVADYYGSSWGEAIENAIPKWVKWGKKAAVSSPHGVRRGSEDADSRLKACLPAGQAGGNDEKILSPEQEAAFNKISAAFDDPHRKPFLIFGVTGSGKSELYIRLIRESLSKGKPAICLVPEIALTEQLEIFFERHFGSGLQILHSRMSDRDRFVAWKQIEAGQKRVVLGPRSAIFCPLKDLGLILIDEEHEGSYKQETVPRYHAREVAAWRARQEGALFVMGTATPSLETMRRTETGEVERIDLTKRIDHKPLPGVSVVDLKDFSRMMKKSSLLGPSLSNEIERNLQRGEGTLLLLNRRGYSTFIHCPGCGAIESCKSCHVSLTFHQEQEKLLCHYCNYEEEVSDTCSSCEAPVLRFAGFGTEKVESEVAHRFSKARIARLDADSVRKAGAHKKILKEFREQKIDILIGTQMIAKGFDFPHVTLVGVVLADVALSLPDFRAAERNFQLLTQVAGRAGRGTKLGRVIIQTYSPDHPSVRFARHHDFLKFYEHEKKERKEFGYPPYVRLINITVRSRDEKKVYQHAREFRDTLRALVPSLPKEIEILGPAPLAFYKLRGHYRWHVLIKSPPDVSPAEIVPVLRKIKKNPGSVYAIDVDPLTIL